MQMMDGVIGGLTPHVKFAKRAEFDCGSRIAAQKLVYFVSLI